ncbi:hypothetical protein FQN60_010609 [Etheostoma spectabile]|uniref:Uncharacterized protein n=1 Tax=Etheostoma spectabile TaxID=54343 RepID=A0A5J5CA44_9PERO|nr:hypothetical protein FQN60_010609 [Etheostoma spectabile]
MGPKKLGRNSKESGQGGGLQLQELQHNQVGFPEAPPQITPWVSRTTNNMVKVTSGPKPPAHSPTSTMVCTSSRHATSMKEEANSKINLNRGHFLRSVETKAAEMTTAKK